LDENIIQHLILNIKLEINARALYEDVNSHEWKML